MFGCLDIFFKPFFYGFWPLMDGISHLEDQWPIDDQIVMFGGAFTFTYGFVMIGDKIDEF